MLLGCVDERLSEFENVKEDARMVAVLWPTTVISGTI